MKLFDLLQLIDSYCQCIQLADDIGNSTEVLSLGDISYRLIDMWGYKKKVHSIKPILVQGEIVLFIHMENE